MRREDSLSRNENSASHFQDDYLGWLIMKRVVVILSGCGVYDGAEIHESVLTLLALDRAGADVTVAAPDVSQFHVVNHQTGEVVEHESRNVQAESAESPGVP